MHNTKTGRTSTATIPRAGLLALLLGTTLAMGCQHGPPEMGAWYEVDEARPSEPTLEFVHYNTVHVYERWSDDGTPRDAEAFRYRLEADRLTVMPMFDGDDDEDETRTFMFRWTTPDTFVLQRVEDGELRGSPTLYARSEGFDLRDPQPIPEDER